MYIGIHTHTHAHVKYLCIYYLFLNFLFILNFFCIIVPTSIDFSYVKFLQRNNFSGQLYNFKIITYNFLGNCPNSINDTPFSQFNLSLMICVVSMLLYISLCVPRVPLNLFHFIRVNVTSLSAWILISSAEHFFIPCTMLNVHLQFAISACITICLTPFICMTLLDYKLIQGRH